MEILGSTKIFWFALGFILLVLEIMTPGVVLIFFGLGAWLVLGLSFFVSMNTVVEWVVFLTSSVIFLALLRQHITRFITRKPMGRNDSLREPMVAEQYLGQEVVVVEAIEPDKPGLVEFNGTNWQARSRGSLAQGSLARLVELDGLTLWVEPLH